MTIESHTGSVPLCVDLFCGLGGWAEGFLTEGYRVVGFDIERHDHGTGGYPGQLVLQDVLTLDGRQFRDAACIVASPRCQEFSYMAMPWTRAKAIARALRGEGEFPQGYTGSRTLAQLTELFDACFRIQREASEAAGYHIPMVVENVVGAQRWVGRAAWHYGSYYLWGDVPALMPWEFARKNNGGSWFGQRDGETLEWNDPRDVRRNEYGEFVNASASGGWNHPGKALDGSKNNGGSWFAVAHNTTSGHSRNPVNDAVKTVSHVNKRDGYGHTRHLTNQRESDAVKQPGHSGRAWFADPDVAGHFSSHSNARKAASAMIAKIPFALAKHIARTYKPSTPAAAGANKNAGEVMPAPRRVHQQFQDGAH